MEIILLAGTEIDKQSATVFCRAPLIDTLPSVRFLCQHGCEELIPEVRAWWVLHPFYFLQLSGAARLQGAHRASDACSELLSFLALLFQGSDVVQELVKLLPKNKHLNTLACTKIVIRQSKMAIRTLLLMKFVDSLRGRPPL